MHVDCKGLGCVGNEAQISSGLSDFALNKYMT